MIDAQIADVSPIDAPLAVSWKVPVIDWSIAAAEYRRMWAFDGDQRQQTVFHDGKHWLRLLSESKYSASPSAPVRSSDFDATAHTGAFNGALGFAVPTQGQRKFDMVAADPVGRFEEVIRNGRLNAVRLASNLNFISVEGVLHVPCDQPTFKLVPTWRGDERDRAVTLVPVVDAFENRTSRSFDPFRISILPLGMRDEVVRRCSKINTTLAGQFEWPTVHLAESISADEELRIEADYHVQEFLALTQRTLNTLYAGVESYFRNSSVEGKLAYLLSSEPEWRHFESRYGLSAAPLRRAVEALDNVSISLVPVAASPMYR
jgi:hypothetical protein